MARRSRLILLTLIVLLLTIGVVLWHVGGADRDRWQQIAAAALSDRDAMLEARGQLGIDPVRQQALARACTSAKIDAEAYTDALAGLPDGKIEADRRLPAGLQAVHERLRPHALAIEALMAEGGVVLSDWLGRSRASIEARPGHSPIHVSWRAAALARWWRNEGLIAEDPREALRALARWRAARDLPLSAYELNLTVGLGGLLRDRLVLALLLNDEMPEDLLVPWLAEPADLRPAAARMLRTERTVFLAPHLDRRMREEGVRPSLAHLGNDLGGALARWHYARYEGPVDAERTLRIHDAWVDYLEGARGPSVMETLDALEVWVADGDGFVSDYATHLDTTASSIRNLATSHDSIRRFARAWRTRSSERAGALWPDDAAFRAAAGEPRHEAAQAIIDRGLWPTRYIRLSPTRARIEVVPSRVPTGLRDAPPAVPSARTVSIPGSIYVWCGTIEVHVPE